MTDERQAQIQKALIEANGNFVAAAVILGIAPQSLHEAVNKDDALRRRWKPTSLNASVIHKPEDVAIAEAIKREEETLQRGVTRLGVSSRAQSMALAAMQFQRENFSQVIQITSGGLMAAFLESLAEVEDLNKRISRADELGDEKRIPLESIWREDRARLLDFIHKASSKVDQSMLIQAKVRKLLGEGDAGRAAKNQKPGFAPLEKPINV